MGTFEVRDNKIIIEIDVPNRQVLPFFPVYDITKPAPGIVLDYANISNCVGHQQRSLLQYYFLKAFVESNGVSGVDVGGSGVFHVGGLATDRVGTGETPEYGGIMGGVQVKIDASDLSIFGTETFSCLLSSHVLEHIPCLQYPQASVHLRKYHLCDGSDLIPTLRSWLRVVRKGGYLGFITPDNDVAVRNGITSFDYDFSHQHALSGTKFCDLLARELNNEVEIIEANTLMNNFSFNWIARKK